LKERDDGPDFSGVTAKYFGNDPAQLGIINGTRPNGDFWQTTLDERVHFCKEKRKTKHLSCPFVWFGGVFATPFCAISVRDYKHFKCHDLLKEYKEMVKTGKVQLPQKEPEPDFLPTPHNGHAKL